MKNRFIFFCTALLLACIPSKGWAAGVETVIAGSIDGIARGRLLMIVRTGEAKLDTLARVDFKGSRFVLKAQLDEPVVATLAVEGYTGGFVLFAEPGVRYEASLSNGSNRYVQGGRLQTAYLDYADAVRQRKTEIKQMQERYDGLKKAMKFRSASLLNDSLETYRRSLQDIVDRYHADNDNLLSAYDALAEAQSGDLGVADCRKLYDKLGQGARNSVCGRILQQRITRLAKLSSGKPAPDFTLPTIDNQPFTLSKMPGKIKIVDFWASWCGPCRLNNPLLKRLYATYHDKGLEIVSISLDDKRDRWVEAVKKDALPWIQVSSLKGWNDETSRAYNVTAIPAIFILDADNHIIAKDLRGEALEDFLSKQF